MLELREAIPKLHPLAVAEFATLRERLLKIGARIVETASRIRLALASACTQAGLFTAHPSCQTRRQQAQGEPAGSRQCAALRAEYWLPMAGDPEGFAAALHSL